MGVFGTPKARFHDKNHARHSATAQAPTQHEASLLRAEAESGHNTGWKMPNAQVMACGACLTNTYQSRMAWRWHAYRWPDGTP